MERAARRAIRENPANAPLPLPLPGLGVRPRSRITFPDANKWRDRRELRVRFLEGTQLQRQKVEQYAHEWSKYCGLTFKFGDARDAEIRVAFKEGDGSWSWVGAENLEITDPDEPTMNFGWLVPGTPEDEYSRTICHEVGHAIGCIHEHQHPAAGIPWDREAVYREYAGPPNRWTRDEVDVNLFEQYEADQSNFSAFDPKSIMIYAISNSLTIGDYEVGWNTTLSPTDKQFVGVQYPKDERVVTRLTEGGPEQAASIGIHGEEDLFDFVVDAAGDFKAETHGRTDVIMTLAGPDDEAAVVGIDDDSGAALNAKIAAQLAPGRYLLRVRHYRPRGTGKYRVTVKRN